MRIEPIGPVNPVKLITPEHPRMLLRSGSATVTRDGQVVTLLPGDEVYSGETVSAMTGGATFETTNTENFVRLQTELAALRPR